MTLDDMIDKLTLFSSEHGGGLRLFSGNSEVEFCIGDVRLTKLHGGCKIEIGMETHTNYWAKKHKESLK